MVADLRCSYGSMSADTLFDRESYLVRETGSPQLEPAVPNFESVETPPPDVKTREPSPVPDSDNETRTSARKRRGKTKPSQSDTVLLRQLAPNRIDIANHAGEHALDSESEVEEEGPSSRQNGRQTTTMLVPHEPRPPNHKDPLSSQTSQHLDHAKDTNEFVMIENATFPARETWPTANGAYDVSVSEPRMLGSPAHIRAFPKDYDTLPPPLLSSGTHQVNEESLLPTLTKYLTPISDVDPDNILTPIQRPLSHPQQTGASDHKQTLPSLKTTLPDYEGTPYSASLSPCIVQASPANLAQYHHASSSTYPTPYSARTPPTTSDSAMWRSNATASAATPPARPATLASTPSSIPVHSPRHLPLPSGSLVDQSEQEVSNRQSISPPNVGTETNSNAKNENSTGTSFKCSYKGCSAAPFPTQYLLNSHTKVHSEERPHFCPVAGCRRGPGGQGFKRKNEMIRHGLVHKSPGYTCPFCPGQQHKYPRPDNLLRHVKAHHNDEDRDDPLLLTVLAQRPEGGSRGRRRRLGS